MNKKPLESWYIPIIILLIIATLAFAIRIWQLDQAPKGALIDELHFGYLAHSLIETGKDEHGVSYPIIFKGFGDQKLPAYAYLLVPVVKFLGISVFAIRIPSLIAGTALVFGIYWLLSELKFKSGWALLGALITAVSPWSFFLSRIGFESNIALCFFVFGLAALIRGINYRDQKYFIISGLLMGLTWYSYIAYRPITVVFSVLLLGLHLYYKQIEKKSLVFFLALAVTVAPLFAPQALQVNSTRFNQVGILSDPGLVLEINENRTFCANEFPRFVCDLVSNKAVLIGRTLVDRFLYTYSPNYLVTKGEEDLIFLTVRNFGQFYPVLYPLFLLGVAASLFSINKRTSPSTLAWLLWIGLLLTPIPTLLVGDPQKVRISALFPFIVIAIVLGAARLYELISYRWLKFATLAVIVLAMVGYSMLYFVEYFGVHVTKNEQHYQSYLPDLYKYLQTIEDQSLIVIKPFYSDPLMFYAFYTKMPPATYQQLAQLGELEASGFQHTTKLGDIEVADIPLSEVGCRASAIGKKGVLVTNQELVAPVLYEGKSTNNVHTYVYVYDASSSEEEGSCSR